MLRKVGESAWPISEKDAVVSIKDASYPIPFPQGLEFTGTWLLEYRSYRNADSGSTSDLCLCGQLYAGRCAYCSRDV